MVLLLDTHILLWALDTPERLPKAIIDQIEAPETKVYFSAASIWEIAIKISIGKADFRYSLEEIAQGARATGFIELPSLPRMAPRWRIYSRTTAIRLTACS